MTDNHKDGVNTHGNIGKLVQIGKVDGSVTIQDTLESFACCPVCNRNDEVKKVSAIVANQTQSIKGVTIEKSSYQDSDGNWRASTQNVPFSGTQSSVLAMKLRAPAQPQAQGKPGCVWGLIYLPGCMGLSGLAFLPLVLIIILLEPFMHSGMLDDTSQLIPIAGEFLAGIVFTGLFLYLYSKYKKKKNAYNQEVKRIQEQEYPKWQKAMGRWKKLYYCFRNDCVFIPDEMTYAEADSINEYVYHVT